MVIFAGTNGFADNVPLERMKKWENDLIRHLNTTYPGIGKDIASIKRISEDTEKKLREFMSAFQATWQQ